MEAQIRTLTEQDIPGYHQCLDVVARERHYLAFLKAPPLEQSEKFALNQLASGSPMLVAVLENEVIGWCDICRHSLPGFTHRGALGMGIHPAHRDQGVGRRLLHEVLSRAREAGLERIELEVFASNAPAIHLYAAAGFVMEGTIRRGRKLDGISEDILSMALVF